MDTIINNISPAYHTVYGLVLRGHMFTDEIVRYTANFTRTGTGIDRWGFMIFTSRRYFEIYYLTKICDGVWYRKSGMNPFRKPSEQNRRWICPPDKYDVLPPQSVKEQQIDAFNISDITGVVRTRYSISYKESEFDLVELKIDFRNRFKTGYYVFRAIDGERIAMLIQSANS